MNERPEHQDHPIPDIEVSGLPGDDFPGIPGADWGMGSRVWVDLEEDLDLPGIGVLPALNVSVRGIVTGAGAPTSAMREWSISVRLHNGRLVSAPPSRIRSAIG